MATENQLLYLNFETGDIFAVQPRPTPNELVEVYSFGCDCSYSLKMEHALGAEIPEWRDRNTYHFYQKMKKLLPGTMQIDSLQDVPVWYYEGTYAGSKDIDADTGPKVWTLGDCSLGNIWRNVPIEGRKMPLKWIPPGTALMGTGSRRLCEVAFGSLSVDRKTDTFLGEWRIATQVHIDRLLAMIPGHTLEKKPWVDRETAQAMITFRMDTLDTYLKSIEGINLHDQARLADAFVGHGWGSVFAMKYFHDIVQPSEEQVAGYHAFHAWYLLEFLCKAAETP